MNSDTRSLSRENAVHAPRDFNRWVIPFGVLITLGLLVTAVIILATDRSPDITTIELAVFTSASMAAVASVMYANLYNVHRSMAKDHQLIRDELVAVETRVLDRVEEVRSMALEMRARLVVATGENRTILEQITAKQTEQNHMYWQAVADNINGINGEGGGGTVPFRRRT